MRGEEDGPPLVAQLEHDVFEEVGVDGVEAAEGFVEDEQVRVVQQRADKLHFLLHPFGKLLGFLAAPVGGSEAAEPVVHFLGRLGAREAPQFGKVEQLLLHLHLLVEATFFGQIAHPLLAPRPDGFSIEPHFALVRDGDVGDHPDGGRLARPVGAEQTKDAARFGFEGDVAYSNVIAVALSYMIDSEHSGKDRVEEEQTPVCFCYRADGPTPGKIQCSGCPVLIGYAP